MRTEGRRELALLVGVVLLGQVLAASAAPPVRPLGRLADASQGRPDRDEPSIASDAIGNTRVVWAGSEPSSNADIEGIWLRSFSNRGGGPIGLSRDAAVRVDRPLENVFVSEPVIAMNASGAFIVVWEAGGGGQTNIAARRYSALGLPTDEQEFLLNQEQTENRISPAVAVFGNQIVVTWVGNRFEGPQEPSRNIFARVLEFDTPIAEVIAQPELVVESLPEFDSGEPALALGSEGGVVLWEDGAGDVYGRPLLPLTRTVGERFLVPSDPTGSQVGPAIAMNANGRYVVTWRDSPVPGGPSRMQGRVFQFPAESRGAQFDVAGGRRVSIDQRGRFVTAYAQRTDEGFDRLVAQLYRPDGRPFGRTFNVGAEPAVGRFQGFGNVALDADGDFSVAFFSDNGDGESAVRVRRFRGPEAIDLVARLRARPRLGGLGEPRKLTATVLNTHPVENLTGFAEIDQAIGAALDPLLRIVLPGTGVGITGPFDFAPARDGRCNQDRVPELRCTVKGSLRAGEQAKVIVDLTPQQAGAFEARLKVETDSLDPDEEDPDQSNNRAAETVSAF